MLLCALTAWSSAGIASDRNLEFGVKAALLLNLARFVDWPHPPTSGVINVCVYGPSPFGGSLDQVLSSNEIRGLPIRAQVVAIGDSPQECAMMYVSEALDAEQALAASKAYPVLTVGEGADFAHSGGMIAFTLENGRVRFVINNGVANARELRISSKLLTLAREVIR